MELSGDDYVLIGILRRLLSVGMVEVQVVEGVGEWISKGEALSRAGFYRWRGAGHSW
jgi:hypothetical protein